jgi:hypothetical protein
MAPDGVTGVTNHNQKLIPHKQITGYRTRERTMTETKESPFTERVFEYDHEGYRIRAAVWNEHAAPDPRVLFDFNNVLNAYPMELLQKRAGVLNLPYAIVSLLMTQGANYHELKKRAEETGECIVALTARLKRKREHVETCLKYKCMKHMHWKNVICALDDKPHEWYSDPKKKVGKKLPLDPKKKAVYKIPIN